MSEDFVRLHNLQGQAVEILAQVMATDTPSTFDEKSAMKVSGYDMTKLAADRCFQKAGQLAWVTWTSLFIFNFLNENKSYD